jgi:hypothetical protein
LSAIKLNFRGVANICDEIETEFGHTKLEDRKLSKIIDIIDIKLSTLVNNSPQSPKNEASNGKGSGDASSERQPATDRPPTTDTSDTELENPAKDILSDEIPQQVDGKFKSANNKVQKSEFERNFDRLIVGNIGRQYDDNGKMSKATIDNAMIVFRKNDIGSVAKDVFQAIVNDSGNAFKKSDIEEILIQHGNKPTNAKHIIAELERAVINAKFGKLFKGKDKPKVFIHDPSKSRQNQQQYITKLNFED